MSVLGLCLIPVAVIFGLNTIRHPESDPAIAMSEPSVNPPPELVVQANSILRSGSFASGEHPTKGGAKIINQGGKRILELDQTFSTFSMGPDLVVILHRSENVLGSTKPPAYALKSGDYLILAPLKQFTGSQTYTIPDNVDLAAYPSVAIWCRKFNATFGAARLQ
ncbi:DM13 domain-containing protein [Candidatus Synechococcus calcipolaris G9]|uniref:DM13 domain-containing protein n=1 Tax=Candidatus Synechococcus calcipolaris G9 TaxID=1497997 RepID=A0ABT6F2T1_9SYNE|nr:DM13 domain-containing protein [Candidatus Synechococcus calcipolaris]MDG2992175.1 DM13 domain-containing protein [Candidatus Synechococcus calcipolaris G9]